MIRILKLRNWAIFLLIYCVPGFIVTPVSYLTDQLVGGDSVSNFTIWISSFFIVWYTWEFSIGNSLSRFIHQDQKFNRILYTIIFVSKGFIVIYVIVTIVTSAELDLILILAMIPLYLFWIIFSWYIIYQNSKIIRSGEINRPVYFSDFYHYFFLQLFLPVGIWLIQLRINELVKAKEGNLNGVPIADK